MTLEIALKDTGLPKARVLHKSPLLPDNGPCCFSGLLKTWLRIQDIEHTRGVPYHSMTQGMIERYYHTMKKVVTLENCYYP